MLCDSQNQFINHYTCSLQLWVQQISCRQANSFLSTIFSFQLLAAENPKCLNYRNANGYTPLHTACLNDKPDNVKALLRAGADVNVPATSRPKGASSPSDSLGDYVQDNQNKFSIDVSIFYYTRLQRKKLQEKKTGNFLFCVLLHRNLESIKPKMFLKKPESFIKDRATSEFQHLEYRDISIVRYY